MKALIFGMVTLEVSTNRKAQCLMHRMLPSRLLDNSIAIDRLRFFARFAFQSSRERSLGLYCLVPV